MERLAGQVMAHEMGGQQRRTNHRHDCRKSSIKTKRRKQTSDMLKSTCTRLNERLIDINRSSNNEDTSTKIQRPPLVLPRTKITTLREPYLFPFVLISSSIMMMLMLVICNSSITLLEAQQQQQQQNAIVGKLLTTTIKNSNLPDLVSSTSDEPIVAVIGQDAFVSCVAKNLQNYTIIWRYTNEASAPAATSTSDNLDSNNSNSNNQDQQQSSFGGELSGGGLILTAGRQRVISDERFSVIQSHDTWLLKISNVRLSDTGTYICHTNSNPKVRALRVLSVIKPNQSATGADSDTKQDSQFDAIDYNFTDCCRAEYVVPKCQRLCNFQQLASRYQSINIVHECFSALPSITRCMVAGRNVTDCCQKRHIPARCNPMCGHLGDTSAMSVQDQSFCADYSASIMSCVADGISTLPGQPELVIVEAVSSTTLKVSWQQVSDETEQKKIDGWIINLTKLSSFEDSISASAASGANNDDNNSKQLSSNVSDTQTTSSTSSSQQLPSASSLSNKLIISGVSSSFSSSSTSSSGPLAGLTVVDTTSNSSLASVTKLLASSSGSMISLKVNKRLAEFNIDNLRPYTVYQIQMFAYNSLGRSQLTDPIRALTLAPESELSPAGASNEPDTVIEPSLPDTRKCCIDRGVTLKRCLDTLCDPVEADRATIADLMICAPWSNVTFSCLSSRVNHTDCCKSRGVTPFCLSMCSGEIKRVDYRHFRCLTHMSTYTNCILESHDVLPSSPRNFTVGPITNTWAVLNWRPPRKHARSLQGYRIFWRQLGQNEQQTVGSNATSAAMGDSGAAATTSPAASSAAALEDFFYSSAEAATNPYLLDALSPATSYETFVVSVNKFGQSESSVRVIFKTLSADRSSSSNQDQEVDTTGGGIESRLPLHGNTKANQPQQSYYNETQCCSSSGVHERCLQLCDYDIKVADVSTLITYCSSQMPVVLRCMAGSRNSVPCCRNRGVSDQCLNVCAGLTEHSPLVVATRCASDFGKIVRCMDEGSKQIPAAPNDLHIVDIQTDRLTIKWTPAAEDSLRSDIEYHIRYQQLQSPSAQTGPGAQSDTSQQDPSSLIAVVPLHPLEHNLILTTNKTELTIEGLRANSRYSIYVTAENPYGISLPSLVLVAQTPGEQTDPNKLDSFKRSATLGAPHSLEILRSDTESIVLKWIAPLFISSDAQIKYRVFYKLLGTLSAANSTTPTVEQNGDGSVQRISSNWTVVETTDTSILLRQLRYSSQYAITVQAFSKQTLGHMSEILLANTAKPIPPTLNQPLVISNPIEGNNITIMCVALGSPTPQISMFINGLLVQKRTQPYVIYHLVNLVRGHLTITCFASNGHGKDYASVQSRTEVSVKFPSKAVAKLKEIQSQQMSLVRMSCEITGNPQPTVVWTFTPPPPQRDTSNNQTAPASPRIVQANERITTLLISQFENPFTWSHQLTLRNVSLADAGSYQCRSRNVLAESSDSIQLNILTADGGSGTSESSSSSPSTSTAGDHSSSTSSSSSSSNHHRQSERLKQAEQSSDLMDCCRSQNVSAKCLPVCSVDGLDLETAFKTVECQPHLDKLMYCAADGSDHRNCCRTRQVPLSCLRWCSGARLNIPALCFLSSALDINQCFQEGRQLLPGPPRNVRALLASESEHGEQGSDVDAPEVATTTTSAQMGASIFPSSFMSTSSGGRSGENTNSGGGAGNQSSVINAMTMMMLNDQHHSSSTSDSSATGGEQDQSQQQQQPQNSEPIIIEWDPPVKNPSLVQYYRIFWRPFGSRELSRTITNSTWIKLSDLQLNKQYEFVVKATNHHGSSVYSDPLTVKPAEIIAKRDLSSVGMIWFIPSGTGAAHIFGRILWSICFATIFMFSSLALVMTLERRGYLKRFASSKSNSSRVSFANPAYMKDGSADGAGGNQDDADDGSNITWENGHSLDVLALPPPTSNGNGSAPSSSSTTTTTTTNGNLII